MADMLETHLTISRCMVPSCRRPVMHWWMVKHDVIATCAHHAKILPVNRSSPLTHDEAFVAVVMGS